MLSQHGLAYLESTTSRRLPPRKRNPSNSFQIDSRQPRLPTTQKYQTTRHGQRKSSQLHLQARHPGCCRRVAGAGFALRCQGRKPRRHLRPSNWSEGNRELPLPLESHLRSSSNTPPVQVVNEGTHFLIPWLQKAIVYDVRTKPRNISTTTGSKDLQMVSLTLRVLHRPDVQALPKIYQVPATTAPLPHHSR
jgi:hypothetical protein